MRVLYSLLMYLITPFGLLYLAFRSLRDPGYRRRWGERLCLTGPAGMENCLHVHAASVGEVNASSPVVDALLRLHPDQQVLITTFTPTGSRRVRELWGDRVGHVYLPLDLPGAVGRFFKRYRPRLVLIVETEIWPNLYAGAAHQQIPLIMINARLSDRSVRSYRRVRTLVRQALSTVSRILAQSDEDASRFIQCGARPDQIRVSGNLKFDVHISPEPMEAGELLRVGWGSSRPVLTAGSTHEADEAALLKAFNKHRAEQPECLLVIAPRHPERFERAAQMAREAGLETLLLSEGVAVSPETQCLVVDSMGLLLNYYAAADVTFLGGTLASIGGHNILEPAALGRPILVGPNTANIAETCEAVIQAGAAARVANETELADWITRLMSDASLRDTMGQAALALAQQGRGALDHTLLEIRETLEPALDN